MTHTAVSVPLLALNGPLTKAESSKSDSPPSRQACSWEIWVNVGDITRAVFPPLTNPWATCYKSATSFQNSMIVYDRNTQ